MKHLHKNKSVRVLHEVFKDSATGLILTQDKNGFYFIFYSEELSIPVPLSDGRVTSCFCLAFSVFDATCRCVVKLQQQRKKLKTR